MAAAIAVLAVAAPPALAADTTRTVSVFGDATAKARNDTAVLHFKVATRARKAATALDRNSARTRRMLAAIKAEGVAPDDIQTEQVGLTRHRVGRKHHKHVVYSAVNRVTVTVRDIKHTGDVIDAGVHNGATGFSGGHFSSSKKRSLYRQALGAAFDDARAKAAMLAARAGATLGPALTIHEGFVDESGGDPIAPNAGRAQSAPIEPGTAKIFAEVTVVFALE